MGKPALTHTIYLVDPIITRDCIDIQYMTGGVVAKLIAPDEEVFFPYWRIVQIKVL